LAARVGDAGAVAPGAAIVAAVFELQPFDPELACAGKFSNGRLIEQAVAYCGEGGAEVEGDATVVPGELKILHVGVPTQLDIEGLSAKSPKEQTR
jgi:hypothetical protein